ncbi:Pr6Pr family membrane protein [Nocardioides sp.]|uniref:Pr6Pr family membrane protein n=1 Tax=Nocardioides sp. TaxID=35761 RepID=UPI00286E6838|nr:Pr6Pr family membrane protein [Nocardioides sp.]
MTDPTVLEPSPVARTAYAVNAGVAWLGIALTAFFSGMGWYDELKPEPGLYGNHPDGAAGAVARLTDTFSYFTIWSNVVVALSVSLLLTRPWRNTEVRRVLRLDALLMITVTAIVYQVLLAPTAVVSGWSKLTDPILHIVTPAVTIIVWLVWGPRGWITARTVPLALAVPLLWIAWMLARGAVIDAYPYDFANVTELGYASVAVTLAMILVFGLVVATIYWGIEVALRRRQSAAIVTETSL